MLFKSNFWVTVKLYGKKGRMNGKTKQNEVNYRDTVPLNDSSFFSFVDGKKIFSPTFEISILWNAQNFLYYYNINLIEC